MIDRVSVALALAIAMSAPVRSPASPPGQHRGPASRAMAVRNPAFLRAVELLARTVVGVAPRVRFEWEQVPGCSKYTLVGQWTGAQSWALQSREYSVTVRNASSWKAEQVTFEVSLPEGSHSWKVVSVFGPHDAGDFAAPTQLSFDVR